MTTFFKYLSLCSIILSINAFAGEYEFNGQVFKLMPFVDNAPRAINKDFGSFSSFPQTLSFRDDQSKVKSQGSRGACAYFSTSALTENIIKNKTGMEVNISEEFLIYNAKEVHGYSPNTDGSRGAQNMTIMQEGFFLEKDMPYQPSWFENGLPCGDYEEDSAPVMCYAHRGPTEEIADRKIEFDSLDIIEIQNNSRSIVKALNDNGASVVVALPLHSDGWDRETGECVYTAELRERCQTNPDECGGHSILITGYDSTLKRFYFKNSWGADWGDEGYGYFSFEYVDQFAYWGTLTADYSGSLDIPSDHDEIATPYGENVNYVINRSEGINVSMTGTFGNVLNRVVYTSTFIVYKKDVSLPIGDENVELLTVPENLNDEYGHYVRGAAYVLQNGVNEIIIDNSDPAMMDIPELIINPISGVSEYYLRISAYIHDDLDGWNKVYRIYKPVQL